MNSFTAPYSPIRSLFSFTLQTHTTLDNVPVITQSGRIEPDRIYPSHLYRTAYHPYEPPYLRFVDDSSDWGSSEFGSAATFGTAVAMAGIGIAGLSGNAAAVALGISGLMLGGGLVIAGIGLVIATYAAVRLIQIANGKFYQKQHNGGPRAPKIAYYTP